MHDLRGVTRGVIEENLRKLGKIEIIFWAWKQRKSTENMVFSVLFGGDKRDRTADLLNAIGMLCKPMRLYALNSPISLK